MELPPPPGGTTKNWRDKTQQTNKTSTKVILILGRYVFPYHDWVYPQHSSVLFTPTETEPFLDKGTKRKYVHIEYFTNYETNGNVELKALELHKKWKFTHVIYQAEQDIIRAARIRAALGLEKTGQNLSSALCFRDKCIMKDWLNSKLPEEVKSYLSMPVFSRVTSASSIINFVQQHQLPVVVKPTRGMGSMDTHILQTNEDLEKMLSKGVSSTPDGPIDYEIEKFVVGKMYHVDGFVERGVLKLVWPSVYINTCAGYLESKFLGSYSLSAKNPLTPRLIECVRQVLQVMDAPPSYSFHVEVWHTPDDKFVFCEAASRTGGAGVSGVMLELFEVNLNKASIQAQCEDVVMSPVPESYREQKQADHSIGWIVVYPKIGIVKSIPKECPHPNVIDYEPTKRREFESIAHCTDALASFIVKGKTEEEVCLNINKAAEWLLSTIQWE